MNGVPQDVKDRIVNSPFLDRSREWHIDVPSYVLLCEDLSRLAREWDGATLIDKEIVANLFLLITVTRNMAESLERNGDVERAKQVKDVEIELEKRIFELLGVTL